MISKDFTWVNCYDEDLILRVKYYEQLDTVDIIGDVTEIPAYIVQEMVEHLASIRTIKL